MFYRLVAAVMTEFQLVGFTAKCLAKDLMTEADAENWHFAEEIFRCFYGIVKDGGVARPVAEEDAVRI